MLGTAKRRLGRDVDIFNPYDGYGPIAQFFLQAFQWRGVKRGDAFALYAAISGSRDRTRCARAAAIWERAHADGHVRRLHRAAPRHGGRSAGQGSGRDRAGDLHYTKQWRLDDVREACEMTYPSFLTVAAEGVKDAVGTALCGAKRGGMTFGTVNICSDSRWRRRVDKSECRMLQF